MQSIQRTHQRPVGSKSGGFLSGALLLTGLIAALSPGAARAQNIKSVNIKSAAKPAAPMIPLRKPETSLTPQFSLLTVSGAEALADRMDAIFEAKHEKESRDGKPKPKKEPGEEDEEKGDYLESYLYRLRLKAFPNDSIDANAYVRARNHVARMPVAAGGGGQGAAAGARPSGVNIAQAGGGAGNWTFIGPKNLPTPYQIYYGPPGSFTSGRVNGIAYDSKNVNVAYLTGAQGGVWKTVDAGKNWTPLGDKWATLYAGAVAVNPGNGNKVYVGTGDFNGFTGGQYANGLMFSQDGGATWTSLGGNVFSQQCVSAIAIDRSFPTIILVSTGHGFAAGGLYRSGDGGTTFTDVTPAGQKGDWSQISMGAADASNARIYYASRVGQGIFGSTNQGQTWTKLNVPLAFNTPANPAGGLGLRVAASRQFPGVAYVIDASASSLDGRIFKTNDGGLNWVDITGSYPTTAGTYNNFAQAFYDLHITPTNSRDVTGAARDMVYSGAISLGATADGGPNWTDISFTLTPSARTHNDQHSADGDPFNRFNALIGNDGGIYGVAYNVNARNWVFDGSLSASLGITQFYHGDWSLTDPNLFIGGSQDNATPQASGNPAVWRNVGGGDGGGVAINISDNKIQYTTSQNGPIYRTTDNWATSGGIAPDWTDTDEVNPVSAPPFVAVLATDQAAQRSGFMFYGTQYLFRWNEQGGWFRDTGAKVKAMGGTQLTTAEISAIVTSATPLLSSNGSIAVPAGEIVYVGTTDGRVWVTTNPFGDDLTPATTILWREITAGTLPRRAVTAIVVNPNNPGDILVGLGGTGAGHLYRCANTLSPQPRYTDQSGFGAARLPDVPLNDVTRDPGDPENRYYVATDLGVFSTNDAGSNWANATTPLGLPIIECTAIKATNRPPLGPGLLNVATFGRGIWRLALPAVAAPNVQVSVTSQRIGATLRISVSIVNNGGQANNVQIQDVSLKPDRTAALAPIGVTFPQGIGGLAAGGVRLLTYDFNGTSVRTGTAATISVSLTYSGQETPIVRSTRTRLP